MEVRPLTQATNRRYATLASMFPQIGKVVLGVSSSPLSMLMGSNSRRATDASLVASTRLC
ncbi:hypothetical protein M404DRAFT_994704, partial [Pisolithus tinctorius Marx 270]